MEHNLYLLQPAVLCVISLLEKDIQLECFQDLNGIFECTLAHLDFKGFLECNLASTLPKIS